MMENNVTNNGGGLYFEINTTMNNESQTNLFRESIVNENMAQNDGSAIYYINNHGLEIDECIFQENHGIYGNGAIFIQNGTITIKNSKMIEVFS